MIMLLPDDKLIYLPMKPPFSQDDYRSDVAPEEGAIVDVCAEDDRGRYSVPFPVRFKDDDWFNASTGQRLVCFVAGWRAR
jgi:hypothetical protein